MVDEVASSFVVDEIVTPTVVDEAVSSLVVDSSDDITELDSVEVIVVIVMKACDMMTGRLNEATPDAPPLPPVALARIAIVAP